MVLRNIKKEITEPEEAEAKEKHEQDLIKEKGIIVDSIKDHLIPQVSSKKTTKKMYEGKDIKKKMNLRTQLKGIKMSKGESIQDYFTRISYIK